MHGFFAVLRHMVHSVKHSAQNGNDTGIRIPLSLCRSSFFMEASESFLEPLEHGCFMTSAVSEISFDAMSYPDRKRGDCSPLWNFTLCKPCSVSGRPDGSHLSEPCGSSLLASFCFGEFSYQIWISRLRGLSRSTRSVSRRLRHCDALWNLTMGLAFRIGSAVSHRLPGLIDWTSTITTAITGGASMDFPLACASGCPDVKFTAACSDSV